MITHQERSTFVWYSSGKTTTRREVVRITFFPPLAFTRFFHVLPLYTGPPELIAKPGVTTKLLDTDERKSHGWRHRTKTEKNTLKSMNNAELTVVAVITFTKGRDANLFERRMKTLVQTRGIGRKLSMSGGGECAKYVQYEKLWRREAATLGFQIEEIKDDKF